MCASRHLRPTGDPGLAGRVREGLGNRGTKFVGRVIFEKIIIGTQINRTLHTGDIVAVSEHDDWNGRRAPMPFKPPKNLVAIE